MPDVANKKYYGINVNASGHNQYEYPGYNYYWGKNLFRNNVPGMNQNTIVAGSCTWTTFNDHNSNQYSYKQNWVQEQIAVQICERVGCTAGKSNNSYSALIVGHSMGTMTILAGLAGGWWKKGQNAKVALVAAPAKGSVGPVGVIESCKVPLPGNPAQLWNNALITIWNFVTCSKPPEKILGYILTITSTCAGRGSGLDPIGVIPDLHFNGPGYFNNKYREHGLIDHKYCGYTPSGLDAAATMDIVTKLSCRKWNSCLQMIIKPSKNTSYSQGQMKSGSKGFSGNNIHLSHNRNAMIGSDGSVSGVVNCHFRGCRMNGANSSSSNWKRFQTYNDNHVSVHSCTADYRFFGAQRFQTGSKIQYSAANHKNICCKVGDSLLVSLRPCNWYKNLVNNTASASGGSSGSQASANVA